MATIFERFCEERDALINPSDVMEKKGGFPEVCITTFSDAMIKDFIRHNPAKVIADLDTANGPTPVYEIRNAGKKMGLFLSSVLTALYPMKLRRIIFHWQGG